MYFHEFFHEKAMTSRCSIKLHILMMTTLIFFDFEIDTTSQGQFSMNSYITAAVCYFQMHTTKFIISLLDCLLDVKAVTTYISTL